MTLQWTLVALFMYIEIAFLVLLMLPWIRPPFWKKIFHSRLVKAMELYSSVFYYAFGGILLLLFFGKVEFKACGFSIDDRLNGLLKNYLHLSKVNLKQIDALREVRKYGHADVTIAEQYSMPHADAMIHMRLFRAQRNLYIAGFALFLYLICRHLVKMIVLQANLMASNEASLKQAQGAAKAAQSLLDNKKDGGKERSPANDDFDKLKAKVESLKKELSTAIKDRDAMKEQAAGVKAEYDRLLKEFDQYRKAECQTKKSD
uniref:Endoplasmic reticulum transmembrane protein n=1 Tax=Romanomermis culicivorax TaxID=13658 RepID=A0A915HZX7_ROMCU